MKRIISALISAALILSVSAAGMTQGFAAEVSEDSSAPTEAYAENSYIEVYSDYAEPEENIPIEDYPKITSFAPLANGVKVSWTKYSGAAKYRLYVFTNGDWKKIGETASTSLEHKNLVGSVTYLYTVRALDSENNFISSYNKQGFENTFYAPPVISSVTNVFDGVSVKWGKCNGIAKYRVYRKTNNSGWKWIGDSDKNSYVDSSASSGTKYTYTVRSLNSDEKLISGYNGGKSVTYVKAPVITKVDNTATGSKITWTKSQGAAKYKVFYLDSSNVWRTIGTTTATNYTHDKLKTGTTYKYTVRCLDSKGNFVSAFDKSGANNTFIAPPAISSLTNVNEGVQVKWGKVGSAASYRVYRKTGSSGWKWIGDSQGASYVDKTGSSGTKYTYTVRCLNSDKKLISGYYGGKSVTYIKAPQITKFENTATGTKITWTKSHGAAKYRIFYLDSSNVWRAIGTTTATNYTHDKLKTGTTYKYTVRCLDSKGNFISGFNNAGKSNLFLAPPAISKISKSNSGYLIEWKSVKGAAGYRLYRKTIGSSWSKIVDSTTDVSYLDSETKAGNAYTYTLRCLDKNGNLISSYISNTKYYVDGKLANGKVTQDGKTYNFSNGLFKSGYQTIGGAKYYYNSSGVLQKNGIVGSEKDGWCYADKNGKIDFSYSNGVTQGGKDWNVMEGKATKVSTEADRTLFRALKIVYKITDKSMTKSQKLKVCFDYVKKAYTEKNPRIPHYHGKDWQIIYANDMFVDGAGNCFSYASAFAFMAKAIGYKEVYCCNSGGHGWAEIDGLIYDPEWSRHRFQYTYYGLSYNTKTDVDYKAGIAPGYSWMHVKI